VIVLKNENVSVAAFTGLILSTYNSDGDTDALYLSVNSAASIINTQNCSAAPNCTALNRQPCLAVPNTCGSCFNGYVGVVGDSNSYCTNITLNPLADIGEFCEEDGDCIYQQCTNSFCTAPSLQCHSNVDGADCSGNGICLFEDSVGAPLTNCTILDVRNNMMLYFTL
jgi:hypothetical protein